MNLTAAQLAMLQRLVDEGPFRPRGAEWICFYSLERAKLAFKRDMLVYVTDAGRAMMADLLEAAKKGADQLT